MVNTILIYKKLDELQDYLYVLAKMIVSLSTYSNSRKNPALEFVAKEFLKEISTDGDLSSLVRNLVSKIDAGITAKLVNINKNVTLPLEVYINQLLEERVYYLTRKIKEKIEKKDVLFLKLLVKSYYFYHLYKNLISRSPDNLFYTGKFLFKVVKRKIRYPFNFAIIEDFFKKNVKINRKNLTGIIALPSCEIGLRNRRRSYGVFVNSQLYRFPGFPDIVGVGIHCERNAYYAHYGPSYSNYFVWVAIKVYPEIMIKIKRKGQEETLKELVVKLAKARISPEKVEMQKFLLQL